MPPASWANANVILEPPWIYSEDFIEDTVTSFGADRDLLGSNAPYMDQGFEAERIRFVLLDEAQKAIIGRENALRLFGGRGQG